VAHPDLGEGTRLAAATGAWIVFEDEAGATLRPPKARTWAARGHTPQVAVSGRGGRVSMAALVCYRPGSRGRLFYRIRVHRRRRGERRSFSEDDYAALIAAAHAQLTAPIILIWDNLNVHRSAAMRRFCDAHDDWLTVVQLPAYAPELNATEGVWAHVKRDLGNLLVGTVDELAASAKRLLKRIQYRPELIEGFRAQTGLAFDPQRP
jgi:transposase